MYEVIVPDYNGSKRTKHIYFLPLFNNRTFLIPFCMYTEGVLRRKFFLFTLIASDEYWKKYEKPYGRRYLFTNSINIFSKNSPLYVVNDCCIILASAKYIEKIFREATMSYYDTGGILHYMKNIQTYKNFLESLYGGYEERVIPSEAQMCQEAYLEFFCNTVLLT